MSHPDLLIAMSKDDLPRQQKLDPYTLVRVLQKLGHPAAADDLREWLINVGVR